VTARRRSKSIESIRSRIWRRFGDPFDRQVTRESAKQIYLRVVHASAKPSAAIGGPKQHRIMLPVYNQSRSEPPELRHPKAI
jgi:hypothetical protein